MGTQFLIQALLNAVGYQKTDLDKLLAYANEKMNFFKDKLTENEKRLIEIENSQKRIIEMLENINK